MFDQQLSGTRGRFGLPRRSAKEQLEVGVASGAALVNCRRILTASFGVRRLVAAMARASERKRRQVRQAAALHIGLVSSPSFARIPRQKLNPTPNGAWSAAARFWLLALWVCVFGASARLPAEHPADLVVFNAKVVTVDARFSIAQALAIREGRFVAVGTDGEARKWVGPQTRVINAKGKTVIPGRLSITNYTKTIRVIRGQVFKFN